MKKSKQAKLREFNKAAREDIKRRDQGQCIFCAAGYRMEGATWYGRSLLSIMHYIPRSQGGLGIPQNGALGCQYHHEMLDNGNKGNRVEMLEIFREHLKENYTDWDEKKLVYDKWKELKQ